jgi:hypothetical protein
MKALTDKELMQRCLTYLTDLNASNWGNVGPEDYYRLDLRQRAVNLQKRLYTQLNPEKIEYLAVFTWDCKRSVVIKNKTKFKIKVQDLYANFWLGAEYYSDTLEEAISVAQQLIGIKP